MPCRWLGGACVGGRLGVEGRGGAGGGQGRSRATRTPPLPICDRSSPDHLPPICCHAYHRLQSARHANTQQPVGPPLVCYLPWCPMPMLCPSGATLVRRAGRGGGGTTGQTRRVNYQHVGAHLAHGARRDHGRWEEAGRKRGGSGRSNRAHEMLCTCA